MSNGLQSSEDPLGLKNLLSSLLVCWLASVPYYVGRRPKRLYDSGTEKSIGLVIKKLGF